MNQESNANAIQTHSTSLLELGARLLAALESAPPAVVHRNIERLVLGDCDAELAFLSRSKMRHEPRANRAAAQRHLQVDRAARLLDLEQHARREAPFDPATIELMEQFFQQLDSLLALLNAAAEPGDTPALQHDTISDALDRFVHPPPGKERLDPESVRLTRLLCVITELGDTTQLARRVDLARQASELSVITSGLTNDELEAAVSRARWSASA